MPSRLHLRPAYLALALIMSFTAACANLPPLMGGSEAAQPAATAAPPAEATPAQAKLEGTVTYLQRIALPENAVVEVKLQDVSKADAAAVVIASQTIRTQGQQVPIPFTLEYEPGMIDARMRYTVSARIMEDGKLTWISTSAYPVLTGSAPVNNVEIIVEPVQGG